MRLPVCEHSAVTFGSSAHGSLLRANFQSCSSEGNSELLGDYCKWCYADGTYTYSNMDDLINVCVGHMVGEDFSEEQAREYLKQLLPKLDYWKRYIFSSQR